MAMSDSLTSDPASRGRHAADVTVADPAPEHSILDRWAAVVAEHPDRVAFAAEGRELTFRQTDRLASALAVRLDEQLVPDDHTGAGVRPVPGGASVPVGVMAGQSLEAVVGMLALARAGRIVVLLDAHLPAARLGHIIRLAGIGQILADDRHRPLTEELLGDGAAVLHIDTMITEATPLAESDVDIPVIAAASARGGSDALSIVFTSGSTGMPKGVVMTHRQVLVDSSAIRVGLRFVPEDRVAIVMPLGFAAGFLLIFAAMLAGAQSRLIDPRETGLDPLVSWLAEERLTTLNCTPHLLRSIVDAAGGVSGAGTERRLRGLRAMTTAGEAVTGRDVEAIRPFLAPTASFFNTSGSSEMGCVAIEEIAPGDPVPEGTVPAGYAPAGREFRVVLDDGSTAPVGVTGQLLGVSNAMSAGYWGAYDQTAAREGIDEHGVRTWRQGDLARVGADGKLMFLGRADDAVKVRGYLVEPSEIEAAIVAIDAVKEAVVTTVVAPPAATRLIAYVVARPGRRTPSPAAIRRELREVLPEYMVPSDIVPMVALPRNERGKVDRARLPEPTTAVAELSEHTHDQWELVVAQIWAEVLGLPAVGLDDDFSALGGDSLSAEEMLAELQERLGIDVRSSELLENPTLREFARRVRAGSAAIPSHPDVMKLASGGPAGSGTPIFCVSGAGALGLTFLPLSRRLAGHDVYAFQQHGLERRGIPDWSVAASARRYLELMRVVQPRGPYLLMGHSLGGLVALEIARILAGSGETVEHVVLLDTYLPRSVAQQGELEFGRLPQREHRFRTVDVVRRQVDRQIRRVLPAGLAQFRRVGRRLRAYGAGVLQFEGQQHFDAFFDQAAIMARRYEVQPYDGRVTFVQADGNPDGPEAWAEYLLGEADHPHISSEHSSLLREPNVSELAVLVRSAIDGQEALPA